VPEWCKHEKIEFVQGAENLKDTGKFFWAGTLKNEYYFTIDDDLLYPESYFTKHLKLLQANETAFISLHGKILKPEPTSFRDFKINYHCLEQVLRNEYVNFPGTGVMVFDNSRYCLPLDLFKYHGMTDLWVALFAQINKIPCIVRNHAANELKYILKDSDTLWNAQKLMVQQHLEILNSVDTWQLFKPVALISSEFEEVEFLKNYNSFKEGKKYRLRKRFVEPFLNKGLIRVL